MSTQSHKGQILPLANQLIPISQNTTFHASYNNSLIGLSQGTRVSPYGYQKSLAFNGSTTYVNIPRLIQDDFTIEFWMKTTSIAPSGTQWWNGNGLVDGEVSGVANDFGVSLNGAKACFGIGNADTSITSTTSVNTGSWFHVAATRVKSTGAITLCINGVSEATGTGNTNSLTAPPSLTIGRLQKGVNYFNGNISEVRIWNYVRTVQQIKDNMNTELRGDESGLVGYWKLNEGSGNIIYDNSSGNDSGVVGSAWGEGRTIATLRSDGKFSGAVAVEEFTQNYMLTPLTLSGGTGWNSTIAIESETLFGYPVMSATATASGNGWSRSCTNGILELTPNSYAVTSIWIRKGTTNVMPGWYMQGTTFDGTTWTYRDPIHGYITSTSTLYDINGKNITTNFNWSNMSPNTWVKEVVLIKNIHTNNIRLNGNWYYLSSSSTSGVCYFSQPQLEAKTFATSFVNGSRSSGKIIYPTLLRPVGTVCFWAKFDEDYHTRTNWWARIIDQHSGSSTGTGIVLYSDGQVKLGISNTSFSTVNTGWQPYANKFYFMAFSYKSGEQHIYIGDDNGISELASGVVTFPDTIFDQTFKIGWGNVTDNGNVIISDLRIDSVVLSQDEIFAIYQSNAPHYNYLDYSGVVY